MDIKKEVNFFIVLKHWIYVFLKKGLEIFLLLSELVEQNECVLPIKILISALLKYCWKEIFNLF